MNKPNVLYSTRHMRREHLDRIRVLAALRSTREGRQVHMHEIHSEALGRGLVEMEREMRK